MSLSPNFGPRRDGLTPSHVVLHYTAMATADAAIERLCDPVAEVSAHYLISRTGEIVALVAEEMRAWHAGAGEWQGLADMNSRSIGIELDNDGATPFSAPQMNVLEDLLRDILSRWSIPPENVIGHSDMAPGRKFDPGPRFDWARLAHLGLALGGNARDPHPTNVATFRAIAHNLGYTSDVDDDTLLSALRLRYRPHASGPLCPADVAALPASSCQKYANPTSTQSPDTH